MCSTTRSRHSRKTAISVNEARHFGKIVMKCHHFVDVNKMVNHRGILTAMVRNAGQLPQPFWLGAASGGGSCGAATCPART